MISGIIDNWGIDIISKDYKRCICGEIFDSNKFNDGKLIFTSNILSVNLLNNYLADDLNLIPNVYIESINKSKYILGNISSIFKEYIESLVKEHNLDSNTYNFNTSKGIVNCIKWYLNKIV